jgi:hypothetical protein
MRLVYEWMSHQRGERRLRRHAARARKARFATRMGFALAQLTALQALHVRPAACSLISILRSLYLDRLFALFSALACVVAGAVLARYQGIAQGVACALPATLFGAYTCFGSDRGIAPTRHMQAAARSIAKLVGVRWVVMGHTHDAGVHELDAGSHYVNLGHWGEDDLPEERSAPSERRHSTYLHLRKESEHYSAELLRWDPCHGPVRVVVDAGTNSPSTLRESEAPGLQRCGGTAGARSS